MPGLLDGGLAQTVAAALGPRLLAGQLRRMIYPESGALDGKGDPIDGAPTLFGFRGFTDRATEDFKRAAGIPEMTSTVNILTKTLPIYLGVQVEPMLDDMAYIGGRWWAIRGRIETDPAKALYVCGALAVKAPA